MYCGKQHPRVCNEFLILLQDIRHAVVSDEAAQISARHAEVSHAVRKL